MIIYEKVKYQNCKECIHNECCKFKDTYKKVKNDATNLHYDDTTFEVTIKCKHYRETPSLGIRSISPAIDMSH